MAIGAWKVVGMYAMLTRIDDFLTETDDIDEIEPHETSLADRAGLWLS